MITLEEASRYKDELIAVLQEDAHNEEKILKRLEQIRTQSGLQAYAALLLILTHLPFEESEARRHWEAILKHRRGLTQALEREVGLRVAALDYFVNVNRQLTSPRIIDLSMADRQEPTSPLDVLTGLWNARHFLAALQKESRRAKRYTLDLSVLYLDIDDFRQINERHGDLVGDILMREVAILLKNRIRDIDMAARLAGEEFGLILPETERMGAFLVAERIRKEVERHFLRRDIDGRPISMTCTVGISKYPEDATTADRLVQRAEEAMHQAKARGGNTVGVYYRERRTYIRFDVSRRPVKIRVTQAAEAGSAGLEASPEPRNISKSGLLFESDRAYAIGDELIIVCQDGRDGARVTLRSRVVRIEEMEDHPGRYEVGAVFLLEWEHQEAQVTEFLRRGGMAASG
ncbi:MAG TPA: diguanylate cyclase [Candidatus Polarisedimenticolia bacterium]|nr:diguanylate cyclase [Candidatus Polarisedimenticolia bacterium]